MPSPQGRPAWRADAAACAALAVLAATLLLYSASGWGLGLNADSVGYADAGRHLAQAQGLQTSLPDGVPRPMLVWPPLYPFVVAPWAWLGEWWIPALHALLFAMYVSGAFLLLRWARVDRGPAACAAMAAAFCGCMMLQYSQLLSEALFLPAELALIALFAKTVGSDRYRWLVMAGLAAAAATLTRYVGQGMIFSGAIVLLIASVGPWRGRLLRALTFFVSAQVPVLLWLGRNLMVGNSVADRDLGVRPIQSNWFVDLWRLVTTWFLPEDWSRWLRHPFTAAVLVLAGVSLLALRRDQSASRMRAVAIACIAVSTGYLAMMFGAEFGSARPQETTQRMMLPVLLPAALLLGIAAGHQPARRIARACQAALAFIALGGLVKSGFVAHELHNNGWGYSGREWAELLDVGIPPGTVLACNHPEAMSWKSGQPCLRIPPAANDGNDPGRLDPQRVKFFQELRAGRRCLLVRIDRWPWDADEAALVNELGLKLVSRDDRRVIYELPAR